LVERNDHHALSKLIDSGERIERTFRASAQLRGLLD
jgi:hypothetical protein